MAEAGIHRLCVGTQEHHCHHTHHASFSNARTGSINLGLYRTLALTSFDFRLNKMWDKKDTLEVLKSLYRPSDCQAASYDPRIFYCVHDYITPFYFWDTCGCDHDHVCILRPQYPSGKRQRTCTFYRRIPQRRQ
ncbi:hypothetical protein CONLIGDRAFT_472885 [Coniochaeta ligniaria NRRL 30616]|uniref:Uncharacterized protein n=1 Tax=Coniochaeta ligniaria NRRL 30616 TaxID=1408157 RepID=A0A1J7IZD7_9PEZI|nr:hypothetical protein CONLIGDRAFT_472885 [Coniochaeta ligniaria NRRL 30616]